MFIMVIIKTLMYTDFIIYWSLVSTEYLKFSMFELKRLLGLKNIFGMKNVTRFDNCVWSRFVSETRPQMSTTYMDICGDQEIYMFSNITNVKNIQLQTFKLKYVIVCGSKLFLKVGESENIKFYFRKIDSPGHLMVSIYYWTILFLILKAMINYYI